MRIQLGVLLLCVLCVACKQTVSPTMKQGPRVQSILIPSGAILDGGFFEVRTGCWQGTDTAIHSMLTTSAVIPYQDWQGNLAVTLNGDAVTSASQPFTQRFHGESQHWIIPSSNANGVDSINHTIRAVSTPAVTSPNDGDTVSLPFTITWNTSPDTASGIVIMVSPNFQMPGDTTHTIILQPADLGSCTLNSTNLAGLLTGKEYTVTVLRYVNDIVAGTSGRSYWFFNEYYNTATYYIN